MDRVRALTPLGLHTRTDRGVGALQSSGALSVLPLFGTGLEGYAPPRSALKLSKVDGYGNMEMESTPGSGLCIVPLHVGYIQKGAQNHAMCRAAFIGEGQKVMFRDACCVQESQGGYLKEKDQWFFVLPLWLRERALALRGQEDYSKLWDDITALNTRFGLPERGHLEQLIGNRRRVLTQMMSRLECLPGQTGALFFLRDKLVGVELAPSADYFSEWWPALVCFCYGVEALYEEEIAGWSPSSEPERALVGADLVGLRRSLEGRRQARRQRTDASLAVLAEQGFEMDEASRMLDHTLWTLEGRDFAGQMVRRGETLVYASIFARSATLEAIRA